MIHNKYVLDAYAILALLENEPGSEKIEELLINDISLYMSEINLGEIYYITLRRGGKDQAEKIIETIFMEESITIVDSNWERIKQASEIKAEGNLSYTDSFALSLALELKAPLLTGDPELRQAAAAYRVEIIWLPS